jgi:hypothetical protein
VAPPARSSPQRTPALFAASASASAAAYARSRSPSRSPDAVGIGRVAAAALAAPTSPGDARRLVADPAALLKASAQLLGSGGGGGAGAGAVSGGGSGGYSAAAAAAAVAAAATAAAARRRNSLGGSSRLNSLPSFPLTGAVPLAHAHAHAHANALLSARWPQRLSPSSAQSLLRRDRELAGVAGGGGGGGSGGHVVAHAAPPARGPIIGRPPGWSFVDEVSRSGASRLGLVEISSRDIMAAEDRSTGALVVKALLAGGGGGGGAGTGGAGTGGAGAGAGAGPPVTSAPRALLSARFTQHTAASSSHVRGRGQAVVRGTPAFVNVSALVGRASQAGWWG